MEAVVVRAKAKRSKEQGQGKGKGKQGNAQNQVGPNPQNPGGGSGKGGGQFGGGNASEGAGLYRGVCFFYIDGRCKKGSECDFQHLSAEQLKRLGAKSSGAGKSGGGDGLKKGKVGGKGSGQAAPKAKAKAKAKGGGKGRSRSAAPAAGGSGVDEMAAELAAIKKALETERSRARWCAAFVKGDCSTGNNCRFPHVSAEVQAEMKRAKSVDRAATRAKTLKAQ